VKILADVFCVKKICFLLVLIFDEASGAKAGKDHVNIGIGLHSGLVMMGIIGENERLREPLFRSTSIWRPASRDLPSR
jgi:hypothetical protein